MKQIEDGGMTAAEAQNPSRRKWWVAARPTNGLGKVETKRQATQLSPRTIGAALLVIVGVATVASRTEPGRDFWQTEWAAFQTPGGRYAAVDTTSVPPRSNICRLPSDQQLQRSYSDEYLAAQLQIGVGRARNLYAMNVHCDSVMASAALESGINMHIVGELGKLTYERCVLLPAGGTAESIATTHDAEAYCLQQVAFV